VGGQDVGKGALIGGATGAIAGGVAGNMGPPEVGNASPNIEGASVPKSDLNALVPQPTSSASLPNSPAPNTSVSSLGDIAPPPSTTLASNPSYTSDQVISGLKGIGTAGATNYAGNSMVAGDAANALASQQDAARAGVFANQNQAGMANLKGLGFGAPSGPLSSLSGIGKATGGLTALAHGGQIPLKDGAYIIPADVVSALGNGSSKAGAEFLRHLMMEVRKEAVNIQGLGAAKKHGA
jgi:hypothetical protein